MDRLDPVDDLADSPGEAPRGDLALPGKPQELTPQPRDEGHLGGDDGPGQNTKPDALKEDEQERGCGLGSKKDRQDESVADKGADRFDLILDDRRSFRRLDRAQGLGREPQQKAEQVEAQATQHALAQGALGDIDPVFEGTVDENEEEKQAGQAEQQREAIDLKAFEQLNPAPKPVRHGPDEVEKPGRCPPVLKRSALNRLVDDALRQVERSEVEGKRRENDQKDDQLVALRVAPDVTEQT